METTLRKPPLFTGKYLFYLIVPLMIEQVLAVTIGFADTIMVARVGESAVSAVALVDSVNILIIQIFAALATGGAVICSQYLGRKDFDSARTAARQLILITGAAGIVLMILLLPLHRLILNVLFGHVEEAVMIQARQYFVLSLLSYPFLGLYNSGAALFRSMGNSRISMQTALLMNIINIGGNAILIFKFEMGVVGAGTASLVSRAVSAIVILSLLFFKPYDLQIRRLFSSANDSKDSWSRNSCRCGRRFVSSRKTDGSAFCHPFRNGRHRCECCRQHHGNDCQHSRNGDFTGDDYGCRSVHGSRRTRSGTAVCAAAFGNRCAFERSHLFVSLFFRRIVGCGFSFEE